MRPSSSGRSAIRHNEGGEFMRFTISRKRCLALYVAAACAAFSGQAAASGFALIEQNASGLGYSYAGSAAAAEDASTIYYNPAGMSFLPRGMQLSAGLAAVGPSARFRDGGSTPAAGRPAGGEGGDAGSWAGVPNFYWATDAGQNLKVGIGVSAPFGLKTEYDPTWIGRFQAIKSDVKTLNINPSVSYRVSDAVALGFGLNYQRIEAELTRAVSLGPAGEGGVRVEGDDTAWGYNMGAMFQFAPATRLGVSYRSAIKYNVKGTATFSPGVPAASGDVTLDLKLPDNFSVALSHQFDSKWTLLADVTWTGWSSIKDLRVVRSNGTTLENTPENFRDTWRAGLGAIYRHNEAWSLKMGVAYDQTPVNATDRTPRLPDEDRTWLSVGAQYRVSRNGTLDFGYAHLFVKDASINQSAGSPLTSGTLRGYFENSVDILGIQYSHTF
jgi:long-chain fatty acid transport protein